MKPLSRLLALSCLLVLSACSGLARADVEPRTYAAVEFESQQSGDVPYYVDERRGALAINAARKNQRDKFARAQFAFDGEPGQYDLTITTLTETDGECSYRLLINGEEVGVFQNPETDRDYRPATHTWAGVQLEQGDKVQVESNTHSNGKIPEGDGFAWARGRWTGLALAPAAQVGAESRKPNILLILVDDLKPTIGAYGDEHAITPGLDAMAARGMRFDLAYCNQAVCAPSRYNLMLGARSTSLGVYGFGKSLREFAPDAVTMPQYFRRFGYHASSMGKVYHIGHNVYNDDASWSIPHHPELVIEYVLPESTDGGQLTREEALFGNKIPQGGVRQLPRGAAWEAPDVEDEAYADGRIAQLAIERLKEAKAKPDQPFFMAVGFARPHLPFSAPKKYWDMYDPAELPMPQTADLPEGAPAFAGKTGGEINAYKPVPANIPSQDYSEELERQLIHGYYASTTYADAQIAKVMDALEEFELDDNTIVVLWGDHGWHLGDHGIWTKHTNYEQANRIPLIIVAPGVATPGSHTDQLAETVDIYTTLADLAGIPLPGDAGAPAVPQPIDGDSLVPVLRDPSARVSEYAYHCFKRGPRLGRAIRTERYRMVEWAMQNGQGEVVYELYDYERDPNETRNIADERPQVLERLKAILAEQPPAK